MIQSLEELVVPGRVLRLFCSFTDPPKEKYVVIVATNPVCLGFLINSSPTGLQQSADFEFDEVVAQLTQDSSRVLRIITDETRTKIVEVVKESMTLEGGIAKIILKNLAAS